MTDRHWPAHMLYYNAGSMPAFTNAVFTVLIVSWAGCNTIKRTNSERLAKVCPKVVHCLLCGTCAFTKPEAHVFFKELVGRHVVRAITGKIETDKTIHNI